MSNGTMAEALAPLRARMPRAVREQEILRIAATLPPDEGESALENPYREVLAWAQRRAGGRLPQEAWEGTSFEYLAGGRTTMGVCLTTAETADIWALRADDPDKAVPGRVWTTEVSIGHEPHAAPRLSVRLMVGTPEERLDIEPHAPGFVHQIATNCGLWAGRYRLRSEPFLIASEDDVSQLIDMLIDRNRLLPIYVASGDERSPDPHQPRIDTEILARATMGLAHVVALPSAYTYGLSDAFGKLRSVYHGAVRIYMPGHAARRYC